MPQHASATRTALQQLRVTDTLVWIISPLLSISSHISLRLVLPLLWRWFIAVTTHCLWGKVTALQVSGISAPHLSSPVRPVPRCAQGTSGVGRPPCQLALWLQCMLTVTELPRDWICVKSSSRFEQISAVIFVCSCEASADGFHGVSSYRRNAWLDATEDFYSHNVAKWASGSMASVKCNIWTLVTSEVIFIPPLKNADTFLEM